MSFFENWLMPLLENYGLLIVFLTMVAESACIPIPSEIVVPYGGFLAAQGHTHLWMVIAVATVANLVGSRIAYAVGRYGGRALFLRYGRYVGAKEHHLEKAERWFERRGELTVFFTRMMPGVRTFISLPAGIVKMPVGKFLLYSFLGVDPVGRRSRRPWLRGGQGRRRGSLGQVAGAVQPLQPDLLHRAGGRRGGLRRLGGVALAPEARARGRDPAEDSAPDAPTTSSEESGEHLREE